MKIKGIIKDYNGYTGIIKDELNNEYIFTNKNIKNNKRLNINDIVIFLPEKFKTIEVEENIATFIEKDNHV